MSVSPTLVTVSLVVRGKDLDPAAVSSAIGRKPSDSSFRGQKRIFGSREYASPIGFWRLDADQRSQNLSVQIDSLTTKLSVAGPDILGIPGVEEAFIDVYLGVRSSEHAILDLAFEISAKHSSALARLALPVQFTIASGPPTKKPVHKRKMPRRGNEALKKS